MVSRDCQLLLLRQGRLSSITGNVLSRIIYLSEEESRCVPS